MSHFFVPYHPASESYLIQNQSLFAGSPLRQSATPMNSKPYPLVRHHSALARTLSVNDTNEKYKTELCIPYMVHGKCDQVNCQFAHGEQDLRPVPRDPNYKTVLCKNYHSSNGFCRHGSRCTYIHSEPWAMKQLKRSMSSGGGAGLFSTVCSGARPIPTLNEVSYNRKRFESGSDGESLYSSGFNSGGASPTSHSPNLALDDDAFLSSPDFYNHASFFNEPSGIETFYSPVKSKTTNFLSNFRKDHSADEPNRLRLISSP